MRHKDKDDTPKSPEQEALERQVDAMMDPKRPDDTPDGPPPAASAKKPATAAKKPSADTSDAPDVPDTRGEPVHVSVRANMPKTAPQLSAELRKELGISAADTKPISIGELDDLAKKISDGQSDGPDHKRTKTKEADAAMDKPAESAEEPETDNGVPADDATDRSTELDDARTDEAVDDIVRHEGDVMLALADATAAERNRKVEKPSGGGGAHHLFSTVLWSLVFVIVVVAVLLLVLFVTGGNVTGLRGTS